MHSSRMRTVHCSSRLLGGPVCPWGCLPRGVFAEGGSCIPACTEEGPPMWTEWLTDGCKNITFPQLRLRTAITSCEIYSCTHLSGNTGDSSILQHRDHPDTCHQSPDSCQNSDSDNLHLKHKQDDVWILPKNDVVNVVHMLSHDVVKWRHW